MDPLPHLEHSPVPRSYNLPVSIAKHVAIILQRRQRHEPFNKQLIQFNEEPILRTRKYDRVEVFAHSILHELDLLPLNQLTLCIIGAPLRLARLGSDCSQFGLWNRALK